MKMKELNVDKRIITLILKHTLQIISETEQQELDAWRLADARHEAAFLYLSQPENLEKEYRFRKGIDVEQSLESIKEKLKNEERETKIVPLHSRRFTTYFYRVAAVIVLLIVGGAFWYHREYTRVTPPEISEEVQLAMEQSREHGIQAAEIITSNISHQQVITEEERVLYHVDEDFAEQLEEAKRITTYHNKEYWVTLPDGSLVHLNYNSRLIYPEKFGDRRDVILEGEAYFMVAHDRSRRFVVHTPQGDVKVYGTEFMVNTNNVNGNGFSVVLVKGSVGFTSTEGKEKMMVPGQQLSIVDDQVFVTDVDTTPYTAWNTGSFVFEDNTLDDLMKVISRWYGYDVVFLDPDLQSIRFMGEIDKYQSSTPILNSIQAATNVKISVTGNTITIDNK